MKKGRDYKPYKVRTTRASPRRTRFRAEHERDGYDSDSAISELLQPADRKQ